MWHQSSSSRVLKSVTILHEKLPRWWSCWSTRDRLVCRSEPIFQPMRIRRLCRCRNGRILLVNQPTLVEFHRHFRHTTSKRHERSLSCRDHRGCRSRLSWPKCSSPANPCQPCRAALPPLHRHIIPHRAQHDDNRTSTRIGKTQARFSKRLSAAKLGDHGLAGFFAGLGGGCDSGQCCGQ